MRPSSVRGRLVRAMALIGAAAAAPVLAAPAPSQIDIEGTNVFPESLSSAKDGTLYIGGQVSGAVYRVAPGAAKATMWIKPGANGMMAVFGVLVDPAGKILWVCSVDRTTKTRDATSLMALDIVSGDLKAKYPYPGGGTCNDAAVAKNGDVYATDTLNGRILKLARGGTALTEVVKDPMLVGADGIVLTRDGKLYTNTYGTGLLLRIDPGVDGATGRVTRLQTSQPLVQPDGMRLGPGGRLLMAEGQGRIDRVDITGDTATITVLHEGFQVPSAVTVVGRTIWVTETKFNYQRDSALKGQDPGTFHVFAVPLGK